MPAPLPLVPSKKLRGAVQKEHPVEHPCIHHCLLWHHLGSRHDLQHYGAAQRKGGKSLTRPIDHQQDAKEYLNQRGTWIGVFRESQKGA